MAVNESWADVLSALSGTNWIVGDDVTAHDAYRDVERPEYAHVDQLPSRSGVEQLALAGIRSTAAVRAAATIGRDNGGSVWYDAMTTYFPKPDSAGSFGFEEAALATLRATEDRFGAASREVAAVTDAWRSTGILVTPTVA